MKGSDNMQKGNPKITRKKKRRRKHISKAANFPCSNLLGLKNSNCITNLRITKRVFSRGKQSDIIFRDSSNLSAATKKRTEQDLKSVLGFECEHNHCRKCRDTAEQKSVDKIANPCIVKISKCPSPCSAEKKDVSVNTSTYLSSSSSSGLSRLKSEIPTRSKNRFIKNVMKRLHISLSNKHRNHFEGQSLTRKLKKDLKLMKNPYRSLDSYVSSTSSFATGLRQVKSQKDDIAVTETSNNSECVSRKRDVLQNSVEQNASQKILQDSFVLNITHRPQKSNLEMIFGSPPNNCKNRNDRIYGINADNGEDSSLNRKDTQYKRSKVLHPDILKLLRCAEDSFMVSSNSSSPSDSQVTPKNTKFDKLNRKNDDSSEFDRLRNWRTLQAPSPYKLSYESPSSSWQYSRQRMF